MKKPEYTDEIVDIPGMKFNGRKIKVQKFKTDTGLEGQWESVPFSPHDHTVVMIGLTPEQKVVTIKTYRLPINNWTIELPGGLIEKDEDPKTAAARELLEETGYKGENIQELTRGNVWSGGTDLKYIVYFAENCKQVQTINLDPVEEFLGVEVAEMGIKELLDGVVKGSCDTALCHGLLALLAKGIITL